MLKIVNDYTGQITDEFMIIGCTPKCSVIMLDHSDFIGTFSSKKYFGLHSFNSLTYSKNKLLLEPSTPFLSLFALLKSWQGEPPINKSIFGKSIAFI